MSVHEPTPFRAVIPSVDADRAMKFGVGVAAAPLWATFFTAASAGMAYWWMTAAWTRRELRAFAPARSAVRTEPRSLALPVRTEEPAPRRSEPVAAPTATATPALKSAVEAHQAPVATAPAAPAPKPAVEARPAPAATVSAAPAPKPDTLAAESPVAGLKSAVEPKAAAAVVPQGKPVQAAPHADASKPQAPAATTRKPPVRGRPRSKR